MSARVCLLIVVVASVIAFATGRLVTDFLLTRAVCAPAHHVNFIERDWSNG